MPNIINENGLQTKTSAELKAELDTAYESNYGSDINLDSDTPDGQTIGIFTRIILDLLELLTSIYNFFDPDQCVGVAQDQRYALNGIERQGGSRTVTPVEIITTRSNVYLPGLDQELVPPYTVADAEGNQFQLMASQTIENPSTNSFSFQASVVGAVLTSLNTITVPITVVLGVSSVNNPLGFTSLGVNQEKDQDFKVRRRRSVSISSQGYLDALRAALLNVVGVSDARAYENDTSTTDSDGIPPNTLWTVIQGSPAAADIAQVIYAKRGGGSGMKGGIAHNVVMNDGRNFEVRWDSVVAQSLKIFFVASSIDGINAPKISLIKTNLPLIFSGGIGQKIDINHIASLVQQIDPNTLLTNVVLSKTDGMSIFEGPALSPNSLAGYFTIISNDIIITPIILSPVSPTITVEGTQTFTPLGGLGPYTFSLIQNESGATINSSTGAYVAGTIAGEDIVRVVDNIGNTAQSEILVVT